MQRFTLFTFVTLLLLITFFYVFYNKFNNDVTAIDSFSEITTQDAWESGTYGSSLDLTSIPGSIKLILDNTDLGTLCTDTPSSFSANTDEANKCNAVDSNTSTYWRFGLEGVGTWYWKVDLGSERNVYQIKGHATGVNLELYSSTNDVDWTYIGAIIASETWEELNLSPAITARYIKQEEEIPVVGPIGDVNELEIYTFPDTSTATHTTAPTQIDGQEGSEDKDVIEWTSFTPTQTTPANTSISYEFRTSDDGSSWTSWSAPQAYSGSPLDLTTLTPNRYLQVRATLSTTDALATPQIDDYTINFHNNQKPNKPVAQTVIIGQ